MKKVRSLSQEEEVKSSLNNQRILKGFKTSPYSMPALQEEPNREKLIHDAEETQRRAYEEGFTAGEKAGLESGEEKSVVLINRLESLAQELQDFQTHFVDDLREQVVELAIAISRKVVHDEIMAQPDRIVSITEQALRKMQRTGPVRIKVNPSVHELFLKKKSALTDIHDDIVFEVNSSVSETGPVVMSETEEVTTDYDSLIANIAEEMGVNVGSH
jgi:flagellar assembly protein FliH